MGVFYFSRKLIFWPLAAVLSIATPVQAAESVQEVEVQEEIKLYVQLKTNQNQKPFRKPATSFELLSGRDFFTSELDSFARVGKKYLIHCNLTFYE